MKAVHIYPTYVRSLAEGITRNVSDLCGALDETAVQVRLDAPRVDLEDLNAHTHHLTKGWEAHGRARRALEDPEVDVVHYHVGVPVTGVMARLARARASSSTPLVLHAWNAAYDPEQVHADVGWRARAVHRVLNGRFPARVGMTSADALVLPSRFQAEQFEPSEALDPVRVIPNGVDTDRFAPASAPEREAAREAFDVDGEPTLLYYGHLSPWKGAGVLVEALPELVEAHPQAQLLFSHTAYGDGGVRLRDRLEALGVRSNVRLVGVSEVPQLHAAADVAIVPPVAPVGTACHPNVLLESMSAGLPVVASRVGSIPEVVDDRVSGLLAKPGDPDAFAKALIHLADEPRLRRRLGTRARQEILDRFTWEAAAHQVEQFYHDLVEAPHDPAAAETPQRREVPA